MDLYGFVYGWFEVVLPAAWNWDETLMKSKFNTITCMSM